MPKSTTVDTPRGQARKLRHQYPRYVILVDDGTVYHAYGDHAQLIAALVSPLAPVEDEIVLPRATITQTVYQIAKAGHNVARWSLNA